MSTPRLEDLTAESQARIRQIVKEAPPLTDRQRNRLQLLLGAKIGTLAASDGRADQPLGATA
jgi:hypothetical protein